MAQNYIDHRIDECVSSEFRRVIQGRTEIVPLLNGAEARNAAWQHKRMRYAANYALMSSEAQEEVASAFYAANAMQLLFRFRDYGDYKAVNSPFATISGTKTPAQLTKRYTFGPATFDRRIQAVATAVIKDALDNTISGTLDDDLGLFTPTSNWGADTHYWTGEFDVWVRFGSDEFDVTMETLDMASTDVELIECLAVRTA